MAHMVDVSCMPTDRLWKIATSSFYIRGVASDVWLAILAYIQEQG